MARWLMLLMLLWSGTAVAQGRGAEPGIAAFYGRWVGGGLSESDTSSTFRLTQRDFDVEIQPDGDGFRVIWTTVQRQKGDPLNPNIVRRQTTVGFRPTPERNVWAGADNADPLVGKPYVWARLERQSLVVTTMTIEPGGKWEMQIYRRTLSDLGMKLVYTRLADGEQLRTSMGRLTKHSR